MSEIEVDAVWVLAVKTDVWETSICEVRQVIALCDSWFEKERALAAARERIAEVEQWRDFHDRTATRLQGVVRELEQENAQLRAEAEALREDRDHYRASFQEEREATVDLVARLKVAEAQREDLRSEAHDAVCAWDSARATLQRVREEINRVYVPLGVCGSLVVTCTPVELAKALLAILGPPESRTADPSMTERERGAAWEKAHGYVDVDLPDPLDARGTEERGA